MAPQDPAALVERAFRDDQGAAVGSLVRAFGDLALAEEAVQEAYAAALVRWATDPPDNPGGWILTTARNRAIDRLRRAGRLEAKTAEMAVELDRRQQVADDNPMRETVVDDRLRLMFTCCHPALAPEAQVALMLRLVSGLTTPEIARAFLVPLPTMAARITRAKKKVRAAAIPFRVPPDADLPRRLGGVLAGIYLVFNEGYVRSEGEELSSADLSREALRLGRLMHRLMPDEPEVAGLLALMLLVEARREARTAGRRLRRMADQDRSRWDAAMVAEGCALVEQALRRGRPGTYQVQAAIQAVHAEAPTFAETDWRQVVGLYDVLLVVAPSPVVRLNRAVAVGMADGPEAGLAAMDGLEEALGDGHLLHAVRGDLLARCGRVEEARSVLTRALGLATNAVERRHLGDRLAEL